MKLHEYNKEEVLDLLNERLVFEREGVKLYDTVIEKVKVIADPNIQRMMGQLKEHRDQEKEHEEWLEAQIRAMGGDAHAKTPRGELVEIESEGIDEIITGKDDPAALFHALFTAELADNAGWDLLVQVADEADDDEAKRAFKKRLHEEEEHLEFIKAAVERGTFHDVLGEPVQMPTQP